MKRKAGKVCPVCRTWKAREQFYINKSNGTMQSYCKGCNYGKHEAYIRQNRHKRRLYSYRERVHLKMKVWCQYGWKCARCGFTDERVFQLDHINGGGLKEKTRLGSRGIYRRALQFPEEYQLLCANCNMLKEEELNGFGNSK